MWDIGGEEMKRQSPLLVVRAHVHRQRALLLLGNNG